MLKSARSATQALRLFLAVSSRVDVADEVTSAVVVAMVNSVVVDKVLEVALVVALNSLDLLTRPIKLVHETRLIDQ